MNDEILARAMTLIPKAADIHKASEEYYITVSVGRNDADVHISHFPDGEVTRQTVEVYCSNVYDEDDCFVFDPDLKKAAERIETIWRACNG